MKIRAILVLFGLAAACFYFFWSETQIAQGSQASPVPITAAELEKGVPDNAYRTIGAHQPLYDEVIYYHDKGSDKLDYEWYPIVSEEAAKSSDDDHPPTVHVLVKTTRYKTLTELKAAIHDHSFPTHDLTGMVINKVDSLKSDEEKMLKESYPKLDTSKAVLFEADRKPTDTSVRLASLGGGVVLGLLGLVTMFKKK